MRGPGRVKPPRMPDGGRHFVSSVWPVSAPSWARRAVEAVTHGGRDAVVPAAETAGKAGPQHGFGQGFLPVADAVRRGTGRDDPAQRDGAGVSVHIDRLTGEVAVGCEGGQKIRRNGKSRFAAFGGVDPEQAYRLFADTDGVAIHDGCPPAEDIADRGVGAGRGGAGAAQGDGEAERADDAAERLTVMGWLGWLCLGLLALIGAVVACVVLAVVVTQLSLAVMAEPVVGDGCDQGHAAIIAVSAEHVARTSAAPVRPCLSAPSITAPAIPTE